MHHHEVHYFEPN